MWEDDTAGLEWCEAAGGRGQFHPGGPQMAARGSSLNDVNYNTQNSWAVPSGNLYSACSFLSSQLGCDVLYEKKTEVRTESAAELERVLKVLSAREGKAEWSGSGPRIKSHIIWNRSRYIKTFKASPSQVSVHDQHESRVIKDASISQVD